MRELLRQGLDGRSGLDRLAERIRRMRELARRRGDLGGTLDQVRAALDQALATERDALAQSDSPDARLAEMELATLPDNAAGAIRALADYQWTSPEAREIFESITRQLRREVLDAQFAGLKQAMESPDPAAMAAIKDMLADLNSLLAAHARSEDTTRQFAEFMAKHGEFFPENPQNVEELIDALARRQAAAQRMMNSLSPEQRDQLGQLINQALADADLASAMAQLSDNLRNLRPGLDRESPVGMRPGGEPMGYSEAVQAVSELAELEDLGSQVGQAYPGATLDDIDVDALERHLGREAVTDLEGLRQLERELERQGFLRRDGDGLRLTPRAVRRMGQTALRRVFQQLAASGLGDHNDHRTGAADELIGSTRPWTFGDELPIDVPRTVTNAYLRTAAGSPTRERGPIRLDVADFEVAETERRTAAAVALCVDLSFSMLQDGRWAPMKQTALALSQLIETRFRQDALQVIGFNRMARQLNGVELAEIEPEWIQGTNLQHALMIAGRHLRRHPESEPVVLVITDGEPTAHLTGDGSAVFAYPTTPETVRLTVAEVDELARYGAVINTFMLGDDPGLARFVDAIARRCGGRVFTPDADRLGEYVVADYLSARRGRRKS
jgi:uncharacterized protein with von Willebrand factor type A (vWA) domain